MNAHNKSPEYGFQSPALYKISVQGELNENWSDKLAGMQVSVIRTQGNNAVSELVGQIKDQSALSGVLNTLYENHFTIISVNMLT